MDDRRALRHTGRAHAELYVFSQPVDTPYTRNVPVTLEEKYVRIATELRIKRPWALIGPLIF